MKFKVYCEYFISGKLHKSIETEASWFLLSQVGEMYDYGPIVPVVPVTGRYHRGIPLFDTEDVDMDGEKLYVGDTYEYLTLHHGNKVEGEIKSLKQWYETKCDRRVGSIKRTGSIYKCE